MQRLIGKTVLRPRTQDGFFARITRRFPPADDRRIYRLIVKELIPLAKHPPQTINLRKLKKRLKEGATYAARNRKGALIGFIHLIERGGRMWIDLLAVDAGCQGRGIGSRLLERGERYARRKGYGELLVGVDRGNERGSRFYERHGFHVVQYIPDFDCWQMAKVLAD
jgi:ribosomal protein S18 acetylase RimI-like enzyme